MELEAVKMTSVFPNLVSEIAISSALGISNRTFYNKMSGLVPFTWPETCIIRDVFFPDMDKDDLFTKLDTSEANDQPKVG